MKRLVFILIMFMVSAGTAFSSEPAAAASPAYQYKSKVYGAIEQIIQGNPVKWRVDGRDVIVMPDTLIKEKYGKAAVGAFVEIKGIFTGRELIAQKIEVKRDSSHAKLYGVVKSIPAGGLGIWIIDGKRALVTEKTRIDEDHGRAVESAYVEVKGSYSAKGFNAREIEVKRGSRRK
ncbi:MAG: DUF5666 domain-containing protein [Dissulfurispiraceae bacterium]|nr:DUF5666 domain-containing protein [Dissulfurispiraceae bacterium]